MSRWTRICLLVVLLPAAAASTGTPPAAHDCHAPGRPADDQEDRRWQAFLQDVDSYRACISDFAAESERAAVAHREAARKAVADWNDFVRRELNAPADFPWPPGQE
ncbi:MAG: hypothetical protein EA417_15300 [Gammaproteobacteria bacterium]|nr:MAG: hypothetical protein EA417_15300 [Gammaproteobacteria bacterium]